MIWTSKKYQCKYCGHIINQVTNHFLETYSCGPLNACKQCPPQEKYSEFGFVTVWLCLDKPNVVINSIP